MEPAVMDRQLCFLSRIVPYIRTYKRGDIIVFNHENKPWISRIVALENDTIQILEGKVIVNDVVSDDAKLKRNWSGWKLGNYGVDQSFKVPSQYVFVLSDNLSAEHDDSRVFGPISNISIVGLIW